MPSDLVNVWISDRWAYVDVESNKWLFPTGQVEENIERYVWLSQTMVKITRRELCHVYELSESSQDGFRYVKGEWYEEVFDMVDLDAAGSSDDDDELQQQQS